MTDKTPSSQEACVAYEGGGESHFFPAPERCKCGKKTEPHLQDSKETPTVKEWPDGTPQVNTTWPRDAKKCTCNRCPRGCHGECCPVHGDGAKKAPICICENPNTYSGRNMNCPIHPFKRDAAPQDSLDEIKKCLGEYAEKYYLAAEENDPSPSIDYYTKRIQDWHITQVREFIESRVKVLPRVSRLDVGVSNEAFNQAAQVLNDRIDRALERLEDKA